MRFEHDKENHNVRITRICGSNSDEQVCLELAKAGISTGLLKQAQADLNTDSFDMDRCCHPPLSHFHDRIHSRYAGSQDNLNLSYKGRQRHLRQAKEPCQRCSNAEICSSSSQNVQKTRSAEAVDGSWRSVCTGWAEQHNSFNNGTLNTRVNILILVVHLFSQHLLSKQASISLVNGTNSYIKRTWIIS